MPLTRALLLARWLSKYNSSEVCFDPDQIRDEDCRARRPRGIGTRRRRRGKLSSCLNHAKLAKAGFEDIGIEPTRVYDVEDARAFLTDKGIDVDALAPQVEGKFMAAFIRAVKPKALAKQ